MPERDEVNDFLMGNGAKAFPFDNLGDQVTGRIVEMKKQQQTDMETGDPQYWRNGDPKMMLRITLATDAQDSEDDEGMRSVYLRGGNPTPVKGKGTSSLVAVKDAVKKSGAEKGIEIGGTLTLQYSGEGAKTNKAYNAPKLYTASYKSPTYAIDMDELA
jgi:hypothetical protein